MIEYNEQELRQFISEHAAEGKEILDTVELLSLNTDLQEIVKLVIEKLKERNDMPGNLGAKLLQGFLKAAEENNKPALSVHSVHADTHISPNDRLAKIIFGQDDNFSIEDLINPEYDINTGRKHNLSIKARISFEKLENMPEVHLPQSLANPYNRAVHDAMLSLYLAGNRHITAEQVYHEMHGYKTRSKNPDRKVLRDIVTAIETLACSRVYIDATNEAKARGYHFKKTQFSDNIIHTRGTHLVLMDGREVYAYEILTVPVLYEYSQAKGQILNCDNEMLALPDGLYMTPDNVILQHFLLRRIEEMKGKNKLGCVIKFDSIYEALDAENASREDKKRIRQKTKTLLDNWVDLKFIKGYTEEKKGRLIYSIHIELYEAENVKKS